MSESTRRDFLGAAAAAALPAAAQTSPSGLDFPLEDYHVHLNSLTIDQVAATSRERGVKYGVLEHAGTKENEYPVVLSNDKELLGWIEKLKDKGVYIGAQAEWIDWVPCFSKEVLAQLDYVLTDSWTVRDANGKRIKAFSAAYDPGNDPEAFMKWYVDWIVEILETTPLDIWSHPMWVTRKFSADLEKMWTEERMRRVVLCCKNTNTAVEIDSSVKLPTMPFLKMAKSEGVKFCFGASSQGARINPIDWSIATARELGLTRKDMFQPAPWGRKPIQIRKLRS
ncbi:MAG: twin-arginine translocation signal domain-containing protein [Bryobacterales bacterium]|nr:twin-arginine translocation signal domain-containing protein [Bryobacterales bacterium]